MRVTHIITRLIVGGAQENTVATVLGLRHRPEVDVTLISGLTTGPEGSIESRVAAHPGLLILEPQLARAVHPWRDARAFRALTLKIRALQPRIVHTHSGKAGILGRLAAHRAGVPIIIHTIHGPSFGPFQGPLPNMIFKNLERLAGRVTRHFISVADAMTDQYLAAGIGAPNQYSTIWSGFDLTPFLRSQNRVEFRQRLGFTSDDIIVGKIARLFELKGHDDLFDAAARLCPQFPQLKFLLVGGGEWRDKLARRAEELKISDRVHFTGLIPPEAVPQHVGIMDALIHLSRREGLARALPQAMAAGKPVIAYDCDGAREVCLPGRTGWLVPPGDLATLHHSLEEMIRRPDLLAAYGQAGQKLTIERFSEKTMVENIYNLYLRLAA